MVRALFRHAPGGSKARRHAPGRARHLPGVTILMAAGVLLAGAGTAGAGTAGAGTAGAGPARLFTTAAEARAAAGPGFALHTLTIDAVGLDGKPDTGNSAVLVMNADNPARYLNAIPFFGGQAKFSVPAGHYFAIALMDEATTGPGGLLFKSGRVVVLPQFTVSGDMAVHMAAASASSKVSFVTPRPASFRNGDFAIARVPAHGAPVDIDIFLDVPHPSLWVSPTKGQAHGRHAADLHHGPSRQPPGSRPGLAGSMRPGRAVRSRHRLGPGTHPGRVDDPAHACDNTYICAANEGYDAPTGLGTPNGISSF